MLLVDERGGHEAGGYEVLAPARAIGIYEGGLVPVDAGDVLYRVRAGRIVVATGARRAAARLPGQRPRRRDAAERRSATGRRLGDQARGRAPSSSRRRRGLASTDDLTRAGVEVAARRRPARSSRGDARGARPARPARRRSCSTGEASTATCSSSPAAASPRTRCSPRRARASSTTPRRGIFVPTALPPGVEAVGSGAGDVRAAAVPAPSYAGGERHAASSASART